MPGSASSRQPKYRQIADELRRAIQAGDYRPGGTLPGENEIMHRYQVARMTARQALGLLINEGLAVARKGAGVYVRSFRPIIRAGIQRLSRDTWPAGRPIWSADAEGRDLSIDQIEVHESGAPAHISALLNLSGDAAVTVRSRRYVLDGKPVLLSRSYLPADLVAGSLITQPDAGPGGTYARLAELGYRPARFREDLRSRMPEPEETDRLQLPAGTPVVEITRTAYTDDGRPVEVNEMTADASAYIFRYDFEA
ncbi:MAG TPA: GntR family transcriptional regulator [Streptosporangiaceae bacterium]